MKRHTILVAMASSLAFGLLGCQHQKDKSAAVREYRELKALGETPAPEVKLSLIKASHVPQPKYRAFKQTFNWGRADEFFHLNVVFPSLTSQQFEALRKTYGFGLSHVRYQENAAYTLADFLTPMMQAVINHQFLGEMRHQDDQYIHLHGNCWGTAYEIVRNAVPTGNSFVLFMENSGDAVLRMFRDQQFGRTIGVFHSISEIDKSADIRFGDVVLQIDESGELEHAAVIVDRGIYFEKTAFIDESPYRLLTSADWYFTADPKTTFAVYRIKPGAFPIPDKVFHSRALDESPDDQGQKILRHVDAPLLSVPIRWSYSADGRAHLTPESYQKVIPNSLGSGN